jgi:predicted nucleic acid-binding protein
LDSSATLAWIYGDETTEAISQVFTSVAENGAVVPALWRLEIANSLTMAIRKRRIDADFRRAALADLALLDITTKAFAERKSAGAPPAGGSCPQATECSLRLPTVDAQIAAIARLRGAGLATCNVRDFARRASPIDANGCRSQS